MTEPVLCILKSTARWYTRERIKVKHNQYWINVEGNIHSKRRMKNITPSLALDILQLNRYDIRKALGLLTSHCRQKKHLHSMGILKENALCRISSEKAGNASHIIFESAGLARRRHNLLEMSHPQDKLPITKK